MRRFGNALLRGLVAYMALAVAGAISCIIVVAAIVYPAGFICGALAASTAIFLFRNAAALRRVIVSQLAG